jgi:hypothetical protein
MKVDRGIQEILSLCARNLRSLNVGITDEFMHYTVEMGSGDMKYIPSLIKIGSGIRKLLREIHIQVHGHTARRSHKPIGQ